MSFWKKSKVGVILIESHTGAENHGNKYKMLILHLCSDVQRYNILMSLKYTLHLEQINLFQYECIYVCAE